jgi:hypothetical protein
VSSDYYGGMAGDIADQGEPPGDASQCVNCDSSICFGCGRCGCFVFDGPADSNPAEESGPGPAGSGGAAPSLADALKASLADAKASRSAADGGAT